MGYQIDEGHFGEVRLDGLRAVSLHSWPGAIHEGNGTMQLIIDERANEKQREALLKVMTGQETDEMATSWCVYAATSPNQLEPIFKPIQFEIDVDGRRARLVVPGVIEASGKPIRNPVTDAEDRVRIDLSHDRLAEIGSGTTRATGRIKLNLQNSFGKFAWVHLRNTGVVASARPDPGNG
jgi:hypothetical protein